jgi:hypothetical protein
MTGFKRFLNSNKSVGELVSLFLRTRGAVVATYMTIAKPDLRHLYF